MDLILTNPLGSHTKEYPVINVAEKVAIEGVEITDDAEVFSGEGAIFNFDRKQY